MNKAEQKLIETELLSTLRDLTHAVQALTAAIRGQDDPAPMFSPAPAINRLAAVIAWICTDSKAPITLDVSQKQLAGLAGLAEVTGLEAAAQARRRRRHPAGVPEGDSSSHGADSELAEAAR